VAINSDKFVLDVIPSPEQNYLNQETYDLVVRVPHSRGLTREQATQAYDAWETRLVALTAL
jgi:hypothetical protein